ncbi:site-specific integrase [Massilia sp. NP310]|uniref:site-specific integrase n=1 Tax=Massilia sp. NP310 TaxID=2861282 RepID=UPI001C638BA9|nr:site-specific integrase [Massilia sp. NP310]QYG02518.1 site-specific integrase [Massilia sp. NP310]
MKFDNGEIVNFDFLPYSRSDRDEIALQFRDAIWSMRFSSTAASLVSYMNAIKTFWRFLDDLQERASPISRFSQIDRKTVDTFLSWLSMRVISEPHRNAGKPFSVTHQRNIFSGIKGILVNRQRLSPTSVSTDLSFPSNPFPYSNRAAPPRREYSQDEQDRIVAALGADLKMLHEEGFDSLSALEILIIHILALGHLTGLNLQPLLELKRDSLRSHPMPDREMLITEKRRGWTTHAASIKSMDRSPDSSKKADFVPRFIGDHIRALSAYTSRFTEQAPPNLREYIFLYRIAKGPKQSNVERLSRQAVKAGLQRFAKRHKLFTESGTSFSLSFARLRPTFGTELYKKTKDIRQVSLALGHASVDTTARYYVTNSADSTRDHAIVLDAMSLAFSSTTTPGGVIIAADGSVPASELKNLLHSGYSTGIAHCKNPFRDDESVCKKFFTCFRCPNMLVFEDDLWRLFSFYEKLLSERPKLSTDHWLKTYGPIVRRIDEDIAPLFPPEKVVAARVKAKENPHPAWRV